MGCDCVHNIFHDYSFVIYNTDTQSYFAARDAVGTRPLYYTINDDKFYYSDDIGEILSQSGIQKKPNINAMCALIDHGTLAYDETFYQDVKRLPPGHLMHVDANGKTEIERYWKPEEIKINYDINKEEAKEKFLEILSQSIVDRVDDLSTTSFEVSGGLDSSSIVSMASYIYPDQKFHPVSMSCKSMPNCDEEIYVDTMQELSGVSTIKVPIDALDYKDQYSLEKNYKINPYWPILITYTMGFPIAAKFKQMGKKRVLTGKGGDQILAGNLYGLYDYFRDYQWIQLYRELKAVKEPIGKLKQFIFLPLLKPKQKEIIKSLLRKIGLRKGDKCIQVTTPIKSFKEFSELYHGNSNFFKSELGGVVGSNLSLYLDFSYYSVAQKHYGITYCHPFYDRRLVEFMLSLPINFKYKEGVTKVLLRNAMKGILPEKIRNRISKAHFNDVLCQQIDAIDLNELLSNTYLAKLEVIEQVEIDQLKKEYLDGDMYSVLNLWQIINIEYWYRFNFINQEETT